MTVDEAIELLKIVPFIGYKGQIFHGVLTRLQDMKSSIGFAVGLGNCILSPAVSMAITDYVKDTQPIGTDYIKETQPIEKVGYSYGFPKSKDDLHDAVLHAFKVGLQ